MSATISVKCPKCKKQLNLPETLKGKKIRCKDCENVFVVTPPAPTAAPRAATAAAAKAEEEETYGFASGDSPAAPPPPPPPPAPSKSAKGKGDDEDANPYGVTEEDLAPRCPHCAKEMESSEAVICLHCGYNTQTRKMGETKHVHEITGQDRFLWLLPGILNVLLIFFLIGLDFFFCLGMDDTWKWVSEEVLESLSTGIRVWFVVGSLYAMFRCGKFAVTRLILNPIPEIEKR